MPILTKATFRDKVYLFPDKFTRWSCNFGDLVSATTRVPGASGGYDEYGSLPLPQSVGSVQVSFWLIPDQELGAGQRRAELQTLLDDLRTMKNWGLTRFYMVPDGVPSSERWFWGKIMSMPLAQSAAECEDTQFQVNLSIHVPDPHFYRIGYETSVLWGSAIWGNAAAIWGGGGPTYAISGLSTAVSIAHSGSDLAQPMIQLVCTGVQTITNPVIKIMSGTTIIEQVSWLGTLVTGDSLQIDCRKFTIVKNGASEYGNMDYLTPNWIVFERGNNSVIVEAQNVGDACNMIVRFYDTYG